MIVLPFSFSLADLFWLVTSSAFLAAATRIPDYFYQGFGALLKAYAILIVIDAFRIWSKARNIEKQRRLSIYVGLIVVLLPYVYVNVELLHPPLQLPSHKWFGDPIWVFTVPTLSFIAFDLRDQNRSLARFAILVLVELFLIFPAWTFAWEFAQLVAADSFI